MRNTIPILLCLLAVFPVCATTWALDSTDFEFTQLRLKVQDISGKPLSGAECRLWSEHWNTLFKKSTNSEGVAVFERIPKGLYAAWCYKAGPKPIFLAANNIKITSSGPAALTLRADKTLVVGFRDLYHKSLKPSEIKLALNHYAPMTGDFPSLGAPGTMPVSIQTCGNLPLVIYIQQNPGSTDPGFCIYQRNVPNHGRYDIIADEKKLAAVDFKCLDTDMRPIRHSVLFQAPELDLAAGGGGYDSPEKYFSSFPVDGKATVYFTPQNLWLYYEFKGKKGPYRFRNTSITALQADRKYSVTFGGPLSFEVRFDTTYLEDICRIQTYPRDRFGNWLWRWPGFGSKDFGTAKIYVDSKLVAEKELYCSPRVRYPYCDFGSWFERDSNPSFVVEANFQDLGRFQKKGAVFDPKFQYGYEVVETKHFTMHVPHGFKKYQRRAAGFLESLYAAAHKYDGDELGYKIDWWWSPKPNAATNKPVIRDNFSDFLIANSKSPTKFGGCPHELSHRFSHGPTWQIFSGDRKDDQLNSPSYFTDQPYHEHIADYMRVEYLALMHGEAVARYEMSRFTPGILKTFGKKGTVHHYPLKLFLYYLRSRVGPKKIQQFFRYWSDLDGGYYSKLKSAGFGPSEIWGILMQYAAGKNLLPVFKAFNYDFMTKDVMARGMRELKKPAVAGRLLVPKDYPTIQAAIDNAISPCTIYVYPGVYREKVVLKDGVNLIGKNAKTTVIHAGDTEEAYVITAADNSLISGFTITGGLRGIHCHNVSPTITNCIIKNNTHEGIHLMNSKATISKCIITGNRYGLYVYHRASPTIRNCTISNNTATGISIVDGSPTIVNCIIESNAIYGIGEYTKNSDPKSVSNCYINNPGAVDYWDEASGNYSGVAINTIPEVSGCTIKAPRSSR